jgi:hypothetical protein
MNFFVGIWPEYSFFWGYGGTWTLLAVSETLPCNAGVASANIALVASQARVRRALAGRAASLTLCATRPSVVILCAAGEEQQPQAQVKST